RVMMMAVAHSPSFYDNAWLKVENDGEVADAVLNQHATATINPGAKMAGITRLNDNAKIMFGADATSPVQVDDLRMNTADTLATVLEFTRDGGTVDINNLSMKDSRFRFQRTRQAGDYATLNIATLSGSGQFSMNT
ncbi:TPA: pertactin-like passenger domain-containing protein, partial [Salmonella enterica subsp. enterica serovar Eastbourne]